MNTLLREFYNASANEQDPAKKILFTVFSDLIARVGFGEFWNSCDKNIQNEILQTNLQKIRALTQS
jgi:hypothetical protein